MRLPKPVTMCVLMICMSVAMCGRGSESKKESEGRPAVLAGVVEETMDAGNYTYVLVHSGGKSTWAAGPTTVVTVGDSVVIPEGTPMVDFRSESMDRVFKLIYFAPRILTSGEGDEASTPHDRHHAGLNLPAAANLDFTGLTLPQGGLTVAQIYAGKDSLGGSTVTLRGKVAKVNRAIMNRNWVHLQDGSGEAGTNDITVTTDNQPPEVGRTVLVRGTVAVDKDFGYGYRYSVMIENAELTEE